MTSAGLEPKSAQVYVRLFNDTDRELYLYMFWGRSGEEESRRVLRPGGAEWFASYWGTSQQGRDLSGWVSYCIDSVTWDDTCDKRQSNLGWKNPSIGWPWMEDRHYDYADQRYVETRSRFEALESHTWRPYPDGLITITGTRLTDWDSGTKRFDVHFTNRN